MRCQSGPILFLTYYVKQKTPSLLSGVPVRSISSYRTGIHVDLQTKPSFTGNGKIFTICLTELLFDNCGQELSKHRDFLAKICLICCVQIFFNKQLNKKQKRNLLKIRRLTRKQHWNWSVLLLKDLQNLPRSYIQGRATMHCVYLHISTLATT